MKLARRIVACLDVKGGRVVKGTRFMNLKDAGDPVALATEYERQGADEVVFLDISATEEERGVLLDLVRRTAEALFIPLTVGGGIRDVDDFAHVLRAGADKVCVNSAAVRTPALLTEAARRFGAQCVVASIDAHTRADGRREVCVAGGRVPTALEPVAWAQRCTALGAGEVLVTSIDRDGTREGYDIELTRDVASAVRVPVIASGGAGQALHVVEVLEQTESAAALVAGMLHDGSTTVGAIKQGLIQAAIPVRPAA